MKTKTRTPRRQTARDVLLDEARVAIRSESPEAVEAILVQADRLSTPGQRLWAIRRSGR